MVRIGIIGAGYWGPNLIRNFDKHPGCKVTMVSDLRTGRLDFVNSNYPEIMTTSNSDDIVNSDDIDAVVIATPVNTHKELGIKCLNKGKHIFIEKPLTDSYTDAIELYKLAVEKNLILAVGHIFQFSPSVTAIKDFIATGSLGEIYHFSSTRINLGPPKTTVDVIWDLGPHDLSILLYLFNELPSKINANANSYWWDGIIDNAHINMDFESGRSASIYLSWLSSNKIREILIFGEKGNLVYDETKPIEQRVVFYDKGIDNRLNAKDNEALNLQYGKGEVINLTIKDVEPLFAEVNEFITCIMENREPINNGKIGCEVVKILEASSPVIKTN